MERRSSSSTSRWPCPPSAAHPERVAELHERLRAYEAQAVPPLKPGPMPKGFRGPPVWGVFERVGTAAAGRISRETAGAPPR
jgi:hypothetical protein